MLIARYQDGNDIRFGVADPAAGTVRPVDAGRLPDEGLTRRLGSAALAGLEGSSLRLGQAVSLDSVRLLTPVPEPRKIIALGQNYAAHVREQHRELPEFPEIFAKFPNSLIGPDDPIVLLSEDLAADYEAELCVVIGRRTRRASTANALQAVAGYTAANDVSARTYQHRVSQWVTGKSFDTFCPVGPFLATPGSIPNPHALGIRCCIGDEVLQDVSTSDMIFKVPDIIAYLSAVMTLEPGDLILTGTPSGVGDHRRPQRYLQPGEIVEVQIEGIGILSNPVAAEHEAIR